MPVKHTEVQHTDPNGYRYTTVSHDENKVRVYTLDNGLQVFLARNTDAPRIQTYIPVRTGSNNDPADNTGLSHYLEHMMFKGTAKIGTQNWKKESELLQQIADLYEQHKAEQHPEKKKEIYRHIDEVSQEASHYAIANEYDKALSSLGATGTNAHTWLDETVYKNNIPSNELERWLMVEKERFSGLVLRLFHTELESVYEEFNRAQDNDGRLVSYALMEQLFPKHPNGQQTTLGKAEHLRNPSMKAIHQYFEDYYVPNNYALVLVGDLDYEKTILLIDRYFGQIRGKELPKKTEITEDPIISVSKRTVKSPTIPRVQIAWRTDSYGSRQAMLADIAANILSNSGEAGLLDLNINQAQKALYAQAYSVAFRQYGYFSAVIVPREDQTLDEGVNMLLKEIENMKKGNFPEWLIPAIINDFKLQRIKALETADGLASNLYDVYIKGRTWKQELDEMELYESITKKELMAFAQDFFRDNYVAVYKEKGINQNLIRVENPGITPVKLNRNAQSDFLRELLSVETEEIKPEFIDYGKEIADEIQNGHQVSFLRNHYSDLAQVSFVFPFGTDHSRRMVLAIQLLQYLGTEHYSAEELRQEFYRIGITTDFKTTPDQSVISIAGLEENIEQGIDLLQQWFSRAVPDQAAYQQLIQTIAESREAAKKDKGRIMNALTSYAKFGAHNRYNDVITLQQMKELNASELTAIIKDLFAYPYQVLLYGKNETALRTAISRHTDASTKNIPVRRMYPEPETGGKVFFTNYDMVQMEMSKVARGTTVNTQNFGKIKVFNEYFGRGLSSIVFQEIRESKSLAYSAYVSYQTATELGHPDYITSYIGTQPDKISTAVDTLAELMNTLPQIPLQFGNARNAVLKQLASTRITRTNIYFRRLALEKLGVQGDLRKKIYHQVQQLTLEELTEFYHQNIKALNFNTAIIGKRENLDKEAISHAGELTELSLEEIFGY